MTTVTRTVTLRPGRGRLRPPKEQAVSAPGRVPRVARLMALAIKFDGMIRDGVVANQSELAELAQVTQPRMTQIMNLLHLAPDIQEAILFSGETGSASGRRIGERNLRALVRHARWGVQRSVWSRLLAGDPAEGSCQTETAEL